MVYNAQMKMKILTPVKMYPAKLKLGVEQVVPELPPYEPFSRSRILDVASRSPSYFIPIVFSCRYEAALFYHGMKRTNHSQAYSIHMRGLTVYLCQLDIPKTI